MLDHGVPDFVLWPLAFPHNLASQVFSPLEERPEFASTTTELRSLDESGHMIGGRVEALRWITEGPLAGCGHAVTAERTTHVPLDGPLVALPWTVQLNYLAGEDGVLEVSLDDEWLEVPVRKGPNTVYLRIIGGGDSLRVKSQTPGLAVCLDAGVVGHMQPARSR